MTKRASVESTAEAYLELLAARGAEYFFANSGTDFAPLIDAYAKAYGQPPDVYSVQGYDAAQMLGIGLNAVKGDVSKKPEIAKAIVAAKIDSPRGAFTIGASHNPVQDMYLRQVTGKDNKVIGIATKALADPGRGCKM